MKNAISIVTPTYNDAPTLLVALWQLEKLLVSGRRTYEIVIIDDASTDATVSILKRYAQHHTHVRLYFHRKNQGIAKTYRRLYTLARHPLVILFSLDGEWSPADCVRLVDKMEAGHFDMVIGWRQKKAYRWGRKIVSFFYNKLIFWLFHVPSFDAGSIKAIRKDLLKAIPIVSVGVFDEAERIIRASRAGFAIGMVPVTHTRIPHKHRFLPHGSLIIQAVCDMTRVWWVLRRRNNTTAPVIMKNI